MPTVDLVIIFRTPLVLFTCPIKIVFSHLNIPYNTKKSDTINPSRTKRPYPHVSIVAPRNNFIFAESEAGDRARMTDERRNTSTLIAAPYLLKKLHQNSDQVETFYLEQDFLTLMVRS